MPAYPELYERSRARLARFLAKPHRAPDVIVAMEAKLMLRRYYGSRWRLIAELLSDWWVQKTIDVGLIPMDLWFRWVIWRGYVTPGVPRHAAGCPYIGRDDEGEDDCIERLMPGWLRRVCGVVLAEGHGTGDPA